MVPSAGLNPAVRHGEIWWADLTGDTVRPVLVLTRDPLGRILEAVMCAPLTTHDRALASQVRLGPEHGLPNACVANLINVTLVARSRLVERIAILDTDTMSNVCDALAYAVGCRR